MFRNFIGFENKFGVKPPQRTVLRFLEKSRFLDEKGQSVEMVVSVYLTLKLLLKLIKGFIKIAVKQKKWKLEISLSNDIFFS